MYRNNWEDSETVVKDGSTTGNESFTYFDNNVLNFLYVYYSNNAISSRFILSHILLYRESV